jgi:hypothetical protein
LKIRVYSCAFVVNSTEELKTDYLAMKAAWHAALLAILSMAPAAFCADPTATPNQIISHIPRQPVQSTAIAKIGYSKRRHILEIEFVNGAIYRYLDVPSTVHRDLMSAESKARFYDSNVKGHYRSVSIRPAQNQLVPTKSPVPAKNSGAPVHE